MRARATAETIPVESAIARSSCPLCEKPASAVFRSKDEIAAELDARDRFFARRLMWRFSRDQLRDLTDVALGSAAAILRCMRCGVLIREAPPDDDIFREDHYSDGVLQSLHETHVRAFRAKEIDYRSLLPAGARVVEVGSYVGGFLCIAAEWDWRAIGVDIGREPVRFCRALGLDAHCLPLHECGLDGESLDAVFVWNCFEQVINPRELLAEAQRLLRVDGMLVIRFPDAGFYAQQPAPELLGYNGLLGWPHRFGYDTATARRLVERHGFAFLRELRRPAVRPLRDAMHSWAREEEAARIGDDDHAWLELTFRRR